MADNIEQRMTEIEKKQAVQDERFNSFMRSMDDFKQEMRDFKQEMRDFKQEMRDKDNQRAAEIRELRQKQDAQHAQHEADMQKINERIDKNTNDIRNEVHNIFLVAAIGIGTLLLTVIAPLVSSYFKANEKPPAPQATVQRHIERMPSDELPSKD